MTNTTFQFSTTRVFAQFGGVTNSLRLRQEETLKGLLQEEERPHCSGENVPTRISASISRVRQKGGYEAGQKQVWGRGTVGSWRENVCPSGWPIPVKTVNWLKLRGPKFRLGE